MLHEWEPPGGGAEGALTHCVIHALDIGEAVPLPRRVPDACIRSVLGIVAAEGAPNLFGVDLSDVELRADDLDWSSGSGALVTRGGAGAGPRRRRPALAFGPPAWGGGTALHAVVNGWAS